MSVVDRVTAELRRAIVTGAMAPGQEFSLRQIASQLGISFIPVREALRTLEADGLLITRRGRSAVVPPLDLEGLLSIIRLRRMIEPELRTRAFARFRPADLDRLAAQISPVPIAGFDKDRFLEDQIEFHLTLIRPAATTWDLRILDRLWQGVSRYLFVAMEMLNGDWTGHRTPDQAQRELLDAYRAQDAEQVQGASERMLDDHERLGRLAVENYTRWAPTR